MGSIKNWRIFVVVVAALTLATVLSSTAEAADRKSEAEQHCVVEVVGVEDGVFVTSEEVCFGSRAEAVRQASDASGWGSTALATASTTIGVHYTSINFGGSSITIVGTTCGGGVWRPSGSWNNNIESSRHYCGGVATRFYDSSTCSGTSKSIYNQTSSLTWMNNRTSCVRYG